MPLYRYRCKNCGHEFEKLCIMNRGESQQYITCPVCGDLPERMIGKPAVHYKGDNFTKGVEDE